MKKCFFPLLLTLLLILSSCTTVSPTVETLFGGIETADPAVEHVDVNDDGLCDDCGLSVVVNLDLFSINDLHGKICDTDNQPGVDELTTYLKKAYEIEDHVILISAGDMWQGSSESNLTEGYLVTEWMNELDFTAMTLGNHEYDWGEDAIKNNANLAEFPFLAINIFDRETDKRVPYCQASVMVERGGAKIGIIGAIGDCYSSISGEQSGGIYFKVGKELTALVRAEAQSLRQAGADFIIYAIHDGHGTSSAGTGAIADSALASYYDPVLSEGYVDIVFEGHTHQRYILRDGDGVYHLQNGGENKGICHAEVEINFANGKDRVHKAEFIASSVYDAMEDHPIVDTLMKKYQDKVSAGDRVLGTNSRYRSGDELRQIVADLYRDVAEEAFGDEYPIVLGGGFLSVRNPYNLAAGEVTYRQLQSIFPFDNTLVVCSVKGSDLLAKFINTRNENYFISFTEYGETERGSIDPNATYYILVDTYTSTYAPNRLTEVARYTSDVYARDLLADHIQAGGFLE